MNRAELVRAIVACEAAAREFRAALGTDALSEWEDQGVAPTWRMPGVTVSCSVTHASVVVTDEAKFLDWVKDRYPTEVETIVRVRPAFLNLLLPSLVERGDPPCTEEGEVIPGLTYNPGGSFSSLSIRATSELKGQLTLAAREMVSGSRPLALPGVGSDG